MTLPSLVPYTTLFLVSLTLCYELSATQWQRIEDFLPGREGHVGVTARDNRDFVNGVLWVLRSGDQRRPSSTPEGVCRNSGR